MCKNEKKKNHDHAGSSPQAATYVYAVIWTGADAKQRAQCGPPIIHLKRGINSASLTGAAKRLTHPVRCALTKWDTSMGRQVDALCCCRHHISRFGSDEKTRSLSWCLFKGEGYKNSTKLKQPLIHLKQPDLLHNEPPLIDVTGWKHLTSIGNVTLLFITHWTPFTAPLCHIISVLSSVPPHSCFWKSKALQWAPSPAHPRGLIKA